MSLQEENQRLRAALQHILDNVEGLVEKKVPGIGFHAEWYFRMIERVCRSALKKGNPV